MDGSGSFVTLRFAHLVIRTLHRVDIFSADARVMSKWMVCTIRVVTEQK